MKYRVEKDSLGEVRVEADKLWGAQTQRSLENFEIGTEKIPMEMVYVFAVLKRACAVANKELKEVEEAKAEAIIAACDEILAGKWDENFPLSVWQTGSGTQFNMNMNEVIAHRAKQILAEKGLDMMVHPNDDVNHGQSSNDTFPTALHMVGVWLAKEKLFPALDLIYNTLEAKANEYKEVVKIGRTHLQDATPLTVGQEISGWARMIERCREMLEIGQSYISDLAIGGTAVGTGINCPVGFPAIVVREISQYMGHPFKEAPNKFHALTSKDEVAVFHGMLKALAADAMKIANDVRWLASGPRCGIGELTIPANEPGSSIMPSKVNPTQSEALTMVAVQVMGNDATIGFSASQGNFQLNVFMPVIAYNLIQSIRLLSDSLVSFTEKCLVGLEVNQERITHLLHQSLILITGLVPLIGYDKAAEIAKKAAAEQLTLKEAALQMGYVTEEQYEEYMDPKKLARE